MRDITLGDTIKFDFTTRQFSDGVPTTLAGSPVLSVHEEGNDTFITAGVSIDVDIGASAVAGLNEGAVIATGGNGYEAGKSYSVFISTGTVGGVSAVGEVVHQFRIQSAPVNWAKVTAQSTVVDLSATDIQLSDTVTTLTGHTNQTGDSFAIVNGAAGLVAIDTVVDAIKVKTDFLPSFTAGAAGGVFIAGVNAATTVTSSFTTTFTGSLTGSVASVAGAVGSVTGAVGSVTGAVGSVAGNVDGNVSGTVASVVTKTGYALASTGADLILKSSTFALAIADAIWDEELAGHITADTAGLVMNDWQDGGRLDLIQDIIAVDTTTDIPALIATAQADLSIITDVDGVILGAAAVNLIWDEAMVETTGAPAITGSMRLFMSWWAALSRNEIHQTATLTTLRNDADDGDLSTSIVSDDTTTFIRQEFST